MYIVEKTEGKVTPFPVFAQRASERLVQCEDTITFPAHVARRKGLTLLVARRAKHVYPRAIALVQRGVVDVRTLITHRFPLERAAEAFELVATLQDGVVKAMVEV
jgi:L-iditol 2-dehydrogenase